MNRRRFWIIGLSLWFLSLMAHAASCMVEAEAFTYKGGWVVDQQFMDQMGSPYLLAHGMGSPVADAYTEVSFPELGDYYVYGLKMYGGMHNTSDDPFRINRIYISRYTDLTAFASKIKT